MPRFVRQEASISRSPWFYGKYRSQPRNSYLQACSRIRFCSFRSQIYNNQEYISQNTSLINRTWTTPCWCCCARYLSRANPKRWTITYFKELIVKTSQKATHSALASIHSMLWCLQAGSKITLWFHPDTKYIRKQKFHALQSKNLHKNVFSLNWAEKYGYSPSVRKAIF